MSSHCSGCTGWVSYSPTDGRYCEGVSMIDSELLAAWLIAEREVPRNWNGPSLFQKDSKTWRAYAVERSLLRPMPVTADGETAALALIALAMKLKERTSA